MSKFHKHSWVIFPLLSILSMSPAELLTRHHASRQMASVVAEAENTHPRFDKLISKVDKSNPQQDISIDKFFEKTGSLNEQLKKEREVFKKNLDNKDEVVKQRKGLETFVSDVVVLGEELQVLKNKKLLKEEDEQSALTSIELFKNLSEDLLTDLENNEGLVAKLEVPKKDEPKKEEPKVEEPKAEAPVVVEAPKTEPKTELPVLPVSPVVKEEPKKEEPKKEEKPVKVAEVETPVTEEPKKEVKEEPAKKEVCEEEGKDKVLNKPANDLIAQQTMILQQMMTMTQMMFMVLQQQQLHQMQQQFPQQGPVNQQAYQYIAPTQGGQWVFQPSGAGRGGMYPDQMYQQRPQQGFNGWGLAPNNYFQQDPMWSPMQVQPGNFGGPAIGFNMQPNFQAPMLNTPGPMGQSPMMSPVPGQMPGQMPMVQPQMGPPMGPQIFQA